MTISAQLALRVKQSTEHMEYLREEIAYEKRVHGARWDSTIADLSLGTTIERLARLVRSGEPDAVEQYLTKEVEPLLSETPTPEEW